MIRLDDIVKKETGSGIGVVIYGIVIMLVLSLVSINILNAKIIQDGYDRLRDSVEAAAAGSVLHIAMENQSSTVSSSTRSEYQVEYDPWLQLALGFLMTSDATTSSFGNNAISSGNTVTNDFIKFDREKVVTHTMRLLQDGILSKSGEIVTNTSKYKIKMVFLEPSYNSSLNKNIDIVVYENNPTMFDAHLVPNGNFKGVAYLASGNTDTELMNSVENAINSVVDGFSISLAGRAGLIEDLQTRPYYFIIIEDFALPTLFGDTRDNVFVSLTQGLTGDGHVGPMFALQGANTNRRVDEEDKGIR